MRFSVLTVPVGTSWAHLVYFKARDLHSMLIYAVSLIEIGTGGEGLPVLAEGTFSMTNQDFNQAQLNNNDEITIQAKASVATTARVVLVLR